MPTRRLSSSIRFRNPRRLGLAWICLGVVAFAALTPLRQLKAADGAKAALRERDSIEVEFRFVYDDSYSKTVGADGRTDFESKRSGIVTAMLDRYYAYHGVDSFILQGNAAGDISVRDSIVWSGGGGSVKSREIGEGAPGACVITVHIDSKRGVYSFAFDLGTRTETTLEGPIPPISRDESFGGFSFSSPEFPLPESSTDVISGKMDVTVEMGDGGLGTHIVPQGRILKHLDGVAQLPVALEWQLGRPVPKPELELALSMQDYAKWLPEGPMPGQDDGKPGNAAVIVAEIRRKDGGELERGAATIRFIVNESSSEPGVCLNFPLVPGPRHTHPDLQYVDGGDAKPVGEHAQEAMTDPGDWREARAMLGSFDWGSYGSISAVAVVPGYDDAITSIVLETGEESLRVPKRPASSLIGDAWKEKHGVAELVDEDDGEKSDGNSNDGDGYTLYEEYRGIFAREKHSRKSEEAQLDPRRKDLIVLFSEESKSLAIGRDALMLRPIRNRRESEMKAGMRLFESAVNRSHAIAMDQKEAPVNRAINSNSKSAKKGLQHGVLVYDVASYRSEDGSTLEATGAYPIDLPNKTPLKTDFIAIDFAGYVDGYPAQAALNAAAGVPMPYTLDLELANTVAHELAHSCSVSHHGDREMEGPTRTLETNQIAPTYTVLGVDGTEYVTRPFTITGKIAGPESQSSGDQSCLMAYPNFYQWRLIAERGRGYTWQALLPARMGTRLCVGRDGSPSNATFGPAAVGRGNCQAQLRLRDY